MKLATLNVCGLRKRSNYPDFFENFVDYDIVCFTEAKIDESDIILFPGFTAFYQPRKQKFLRKSGGIVVYVKNSLAKFVSKIESESDYVLWLSFSEGLLQNIDHFILGVVYIPPESSNFYNEDEIMAFENEVTSLQGGESRDLFRLFRICIRTGPVRKFFIISLILNEFSCGDVLMSCLCNQQTNIEVFCAYAL